MSNYTAKRRAGGGPNVGQPLIQMDLWEALSTTEINVYWTQDITAGGFNNLDFTMQPSGLHPQSILQLGTNGAYMTFAGSIAADTEIVYDGDRQGFLSPQTLGVP